ncbi:hypothetical protein ACIBEA_39675 [Streptomyces sp. NPDC051555]|uniref:hypothetical protein n=1 Tax=Streptomyces sp. NPDC051555 TaxID=3365657 RepID=UPI0037B9F115
MSHVRRSPAEVQAVKDAVLAARATVIKDYQGGESLAQLARRHQVARKWLREQLVEWEIALRDRSAACKAQGASGPRPSLSPGAGRGIGARSGHGSVSEKNRASRVGTLIASAGSVS